MFPNSQSFWSHCSEHQWGAQKWLWMLFEKITKTTHLKLHCKMTATGMTGKLQKYIERSKFCELQLEVTGVHLWCLTNLLDRDKKAFPFHGCHKLNGDSAFVLCTDWIHPNRGGEHVHRAAGWKWPFTVVLWPEASVAATAALCQE